MNSATPSAARYQATVRRILELLRQQRVTEAVSACRSFSATNPESNDALLLLGKARQMQGRFDDMLELVETALSREPQNVSLQLQFAGACRFCGQHDRALAQLVQVEQTARNNAGLLQNVAQLYVLIGKHEDAHRCYLRAVELEDNNPQFLNNLAASFIATGDLSRAERAYSEVIERAPDNYDAWHNRSTLRKQSADDNHVPDLESALHKLAADDAGTAPLCYALAKEYEDLGEDEKCFSYLKRGADLLHRQSGYDVEADVSVMKRITELFDQDFVASVRGAAERPGPIFVLGLPRSGSTLVDRIIGSHSEVESMGEISDFALSLTRLSQSTDRDRQLAASVKIDPDKLGQDYARSVASYAPSTPYFIDKTPTNFLYLGLIAKALPGASVIHVHRHPVDSCLSMYRALFRTAYPFSYDLDDLAEYYIAHDALMTHWRTVFPEFVLDVSYEEIIEDQERASRKIISHCGLEWESACLEFDRNTAPVTTASAAQVRKPIYRDALARWRRFEVQLAPLIARFEEAGIAI